MYIVFLYIYSAPQNVNGSSTEMTTASERKEQKKKNNGTILWFFPGGKLALYYDI